MNIKINRKSFEVNQNVVPDSLMLMLNFYYARDAERFYFWKHQLEIAFDLSEDKYPVILC